MLASKKQEWVITHEYAPQPDTRRQVRSLPSLNIELRKKCCALAVLLLLLAGIATLQSERIVSNGYQYIKMQNDLRDIEQQNEKLRIEIARLKSLDRIQSIAVNNLGMTAPQQVYSVSLPSADSGKLAVNKKQEQPRPKL